MALINVYKLDMNNKLTSNHPLIYSLNVSDQINEQNYQLALKTLNEYEEKKDLMANIQGSYYIKEYFYLLRGECYLKTSKYHESIRDLSESLQKEKYNNHHPAYFLRALAYIQTGDLQNALKDLDKAIELDMTNLSCYVERARVYFLLKDYNKSLENINFIFDIEHEVLNNDSLDYRGRGIISNRLKINIPNIYLIRGLINAASDNHSAAMNDYNKSIELDSSNPNFYYERGLLRKKLGDSYGATEDFLVSVKQEPDNTKYCTSLAFSQYESNDTEAALSTINSCISKNPNDHIVFMSSSALKFELEDFHGALTDISRALELDSNNGDYHIKMGIIKHRIGDKSGACQSWSRAGQLGVMRAFELIQEHCPKKNITEF
jgi:tetratricopeptide (TPR) repeat protein